MTPNETSAASLKPSPRAWPIFAVPAVLALVGYVVMYNVDARLRTNHGPWEVAFLVDTEGTPAVIIRQDTLGISNITVRFIGESIPTPQNPPIPVRFDTPLRAIPFGATTFDDLMYLPGTVVLHCFGHEVQMLPRGLFLNRKEHAWTVPATYELQPGDKLPSLDPPKKGPRAQPVN